MNVISQVILAIVAVISLITAYVVFAPDDLPKTISPGLRYRHRPAGSLIRRPHHHCSNRNPGPGGTRIQTGEGVMLNMSTKIINLTDPGGRKYIRLTVVVEFAPDDPAYPKMAAAEKNDLPDRFNAKLTALLPIMDDTVITLLSTKAYEDLYTADGKEKLRIEIMDILAKSFPISRSSQSILQNLWSSKLC